MGDDDMAKVNLAEEAILKGQRPYARQLANGVVNRTSADHRAHAKAKDILAYLDVRDG